MIDTSPGADKFIPVPVCFKKEKHLYNPYMSYASTGKDSILSFQTGLVRTVPLPMWIVRVYIRVYSGITDWSPGSSVD